MEPASERLVDWLNIFQELAALANGTGEITASQFQAVIPVHADPEDIERLIENLNARAFG